jgi:hypothetical protein
MFYTIVPSSAVMFAVKRMQLNISVTVDVKLRGSVCVVLQAVDSLERTNEVYNI